MNRPMPTSPPEKRHGAEHECSIQAFSKHHMLFHTQAYCKTHTHTHSKHACAHPTQPKSSQRQRGWDIQRCSNPKRTQQKKTSNNTSFCPKLRQQKTIQKASFKGWPPRALLPKHQLLGADTKDRGRSLISPSCFQGHTSRRFACPWKHL